MPTTTQRIDRHEQNLAINGNFDIWQRGTSFPSVGNVYTADRFRHFKNGTMVGDAARSTVIPTYVQSKFQSVYSHLYTVTTAQASLSAANHQIFRYVVEGQDYANIASGGSFRVQFWVRSSKTGAHAISFQNALSDRSYVTTYTINVANTWEKKTVDVASDTSGTWQLDNGAGLGIYWALSAGSNYVTATTNAWQAGNVYAPSSAVNVNDTISATWAIAQISIIPGVLSSNVDALFQRAGKTIQQELAMCQRYYHRPQYDSSDSTARFGVGQAVSTTLVVFPMQVPVSMRAFPSLTFSGLGVSNATLTTQALTACALAGAASTLIFQINLSVASGLVAGNASILARNSNAADFIALDADF